jgi:NADH:ubiquinone oxidoreductase subunit 3 (subunit A)
MSGNMNLIVYKFDLVYTFLLMSIIFLVVSLILASLFYLISLFLYDNVYDYTGVSFECGFDPSSDITIRPFYVIRYFIIGLVFLVFDLELVLFLPFILSSSTLPAICTLCFFFLLFVVVWTFYLEYSENVFYFSG